MLSLGEIQAKMGGLRDWAIEGNSIAKVFSFGGFKECLEFVGKVGEIAIAKEHYPDILISFDRVRVSLSGSMDGICEKDFEVAGEIDGI